MSSSSSSSWETRVRDVAAARLLHFATAAAQNDIAPPLLLSACDTLSAILRTYDGCEPPSSEDSLGSSVVRLRHHVEQARALPSPLPPADALILSITEAIFVLAAQWPSIEAAPSPSEEAAPIQDSSESPRSDDSEIEEGRETEEEEAEVVEEPGYAVPVQSEESLVVAKKLSPNEQLKILLAQFHTESEGGKEEKEAETPESSTGRSGRRTRTFAPRKIRRHDPAVDRSKNKYICEECGLALRTPSRLVSHGWIHSGIRPFACPACPASYTRRDVLVGHVARAHPESSFDIPGRTRRTQKRKMAEADAAKRREAVERGGSNEGMADDEALPASECGDDGMEEEGPIDEFDEKTGAEALFD